MKRKQNISRREALRVLGVLGGAAVGSTLLPGTLLSKTTRVIQKKGLDIGLDFSMFHNKLSGSFDYYHNTTKNLIYDATVPVPPNLSSHEWINVGKLASAGYEASITASIIRNRNLFLAE